MSSVLDIVWSGWSELGRVIGVGTVAYFGAVVLLRTAGQQALTKMTAYGLLVTVALGSVLATALLSSQVKIDKALVAFALLLALQRVLAWLSFRSRRVRKFVNNDPILLLHRGRMLDSAMRRANVTQDEIEAAVRSQGAGGLDQVYVVVLETDGSLSVISSGNRGDERALGDLVQSALPAGQANPSDGAR